MELKNILTMKKGEKWQAEREREERESAAEKALMILGFL